MRNRLIDLIRQSHCVEVWDYWNDDFKEPDPAEKLADHLIANGVIVSPCKVGDTVYNIDGECVSDSVVIECKIDECATGFKSQTYYGEEMDFDDYEIGKCIFLTREEAKKALKERQTNENT